MPSSNIKKDTIVGLLFFGTIGVLLYFTFVLTEFSFREKEQLKILFKEAHQLQQGDSVQVMGTRVGRVLSVSYDESHGEDYRILVNAQLDAPVTLHEGYNIRIEESNLLGGRIVYINPGEVVKPQVDSKGIHYGEIGKDPLKELGKLIDDNRENIREAIDDLKKAFEGLPKGEGTLGKLLQNDEMYEEVKQAFANVKEISEAIKKGEGTIGKLLTEDKIYNDIESFVADVKAGKGVLGELIYNEKMAADLKEAMASITKISDLVRNGDGTFAKLLKDDAIYKEWTEAGQTVKEIVADIKAGKGTVGKLINDDKLYEDLLTVIRTANRSIEDAREAAPIATFSALLFSSF